MNLAEAASMYADRTALRMDDVQVTYAELDDASARLATHLLAEGISAGDRVAVMLPNVPAFAVVYYGVLRAGGVVVPMNPLLKAREVEYYLRDSGARWLFASPAAVPEAKSAAETVGTALVETDEDSLGELLTRLVATTEIVSRADDDTAVILYTSGTTGSPKGAELSHANLGHNQAVTSRTLLHLGPDDVVMGCLPLFHVFGMTCGLNAAITNGALLTLIPRFDPAKALDVVARDGVTVFEGVPTMYAAMLGLADSHPVDVSSLRVCISGGAALPVEVLRGFETAFRCLVLEGYGLSETSPVASFNHPDRERKPGSIGTPIDGVRMRVVDVDGADVAPGEVGEILISGHNIMKGYWQRPEATAEAIKDGWFATGDLAKVDEDGYHFIVDRKKDLIIRGGYNVYPREVEEVLYEHPAVAEAAVVGMPHNSLGEEIGAAVALKAGTEVTPEELRDFVKSRIAAYKYPREVWVVDTLPKTATGKILRREVHPPIEGAS
jgi:long-chain acyl-CoA synthetase